MKKFYLKALLFATLVCATLLLLDYGISAALKLDKKSNLGVWNAIYKGQINSDIIINGSSRAVYHIDPRIVSKTLNRSTYNFGMDGQMFEMQYCRFKIFLEHNPPPKIVIQSMDCHTLCKTEGIYGYQQFLPYLSDKTLKNTLSKFEGISANDYNIPMSKYAGEFILISDAVKLALGKNNTPDRFNGFEGHDRVWNNDLEEAKKLYPDKLEYKLDKGVIKQFEEYIQFCKINKIKLILVYTPEYIEGQKLIKNREEIIKLYETLADKYQIPFLNYSTSKLSLNRTLFYNSLHLNTGGAEKFTAAMSKDIKDLSESKDSPDLRLALHRLSSSSVKRSAESLND